MPQLSPIIRRIIVSVAVAAVFVLVRNFLKKQKDRRKQKEMTLLQRRNEALNETLRNPKMQKTDGVVAGPMEIQWDERAINQKKTKHSAMMIELVEFAAYSRRKYLFPVGQMICIGSGENNQVVLARDGVAAKHCEIFQADHAIAIRNVSETTALLIRGKTSVLISTEGVFLNDGDRIKMGAAEIQFRCFKA